MYFRFFVIISPWKWAGPFIWTNLNPVHPRMHCAKFGCNCPSGSEEKYFLISSMYYCFFVSISPWKRAGPFIWTIWILFTQRCIVPSLVEIGQVVLERKIFFNFVNVFSLFGNYHPLIKGGVLYLNKLESSSPNNALYKVWLKLAQWFWRIFF